MNKFVPLFVALASMAIHVRAQIDNAGSGRAIYFDGVDDYVDLGNIYDDTTFPLTISAWVYVDADKFAVPIFVSQDNDPIYNGYWFCLGESSVFFEYGDGRGENHNSFRRGKSASISNFMRRWVHFCAVVRSGSDIDLFMNGQNVGGSYVGGSTLPMASNYPNDVAKIGKFVSNSIEYNFRGMIDELRIWNRALSQTEVRETMCRRLNGDEPGLIGNWRFDETEGTDLLDNGPGGFHGVLKGSPTRMYSGAPIGDASAYLYSSDWANKELTLDEATVSNISGNPWGAHIYRVDLAPSQAGGLIASKLIVPYYGVFLADIDQNNQFDVSLGTHSCESFQRSDNSMSNWTVNSPTRKANRVEIISAGEPDEEFELHLADSVRLCDQESYMIQPLGTPEEATFLWSTGATTSSVSVYETGTYYLSVTSGCEVKQDSVYISFATTPPSFAIGEDEVSCIFEPRVITANLELDANEYSVTWQDGSGGMSFLAEDFGIYWLKLENGCGISVDSMIVSRVILDDLETYNFISPDNGDYLNQVFHIDGRILGSSLRVYNKWGKLVYTSLDYHNTWDGGNLSSGVYFYIIEHPCIQPTKGTLTIMR